jgi:hypothetical protein
MGVILLPCGFGREDVTLAAEIAKRTRDGPRDLEQVPDADVRVIGEGEIHRGGLGHPHRDA